MDLKRKKIGLALGSGGIRGFAHIGVIKTLIQHHIPIDAIAGVSVGSLIGGLYLSLGDIDKVEAFALSISYWELASLVSDLTWSTGIIRGEKIHEFLEQQNHDVTIESLSIPFAAVATDTRTGKVVPIQTGNLSTAIIASSAVPTVVSAVTMGDYQLVDGGISDPVPVDIVKTLGVDITIGVNLDAGFFPIKISEQDDKNNPFSTGMTMFDSLRYHLAKRSVIGSDIVIEPELPKTGFKEIEQGKAFIERGVEATEKIIPELQKLLKQDVI